MNIDFEQINKIIELFENSKLGELEIEQGDSRVRMARQPSGAVHIQAAPTNEPSNATASAALPSSDKDSDFITSPFVGTFYRSASPTSKPFINVGDAVKAGQPLCIVEAMKLMNEIVADTSGTIVEVLANDAQPVECGQRLFRIKAT